MTSKTAPATQKRPRASLNVKKRQVWRVVSLAELSTERQIQNSICEILDYLRLPYSVTDASRVYAADGQLGARRWQQDWPDITGCTWPVGFFALRSRELKVDSPKNNVRNFSDD